MSFYPLSSTFLNVQQIKLNVVNTLFALSIATYYVAGHFLPKMMSWGRHPNSYGAEDSVGGKKVLIPLSSLLDPSSALSHRVLPSEIPGFSRFSSLMSSDLPSTFEPKPSFSTPPLPPPSSPLALKVTELQASRALESAQELIFSFPFVSTPPANFHSYVISELGIHCFQKENLRIHSSGTQEIKADPAFLDLRFGEHYRGVLQILDRPFCENDRGVIQNLPAPLAIAFQRQETDCIFFASPQPVTAAVASSSQSVLQEPVVENTQSSPARIESAIPSPPLEEVPSPPKRTVLPSWKTDKRVLNAHRARNFRPMAIFWLKRIDSYFPTLTPDDMLFAQALQETILEHFSHLDWGWCEETRNEDRRKFFNHYIEAVDWQNTSHKRLYPPEAKKDLHNANDEALLDVHGFPQKLGIAPYYDRDLH